ncbi:MAG: type II toxin-antitoxin system RelE/ParE family toxin [Pirellulales bacterium]|nr:type II toxin-antitoxin system RelE/ParE family toxin [Pirellulales bacterium]
MNRFILSPRAEADIQAIWDYIGIRNNCPQAARNFLDRLSQKFALLASEPLMGESRDDLRPNLRVFSEESYGIFIILIPTVWKS